VPDENQDAAVTHERRRLHRILKDVVPHYAPMIPTLVATAFHRDG